MPVTGPWALPGPAAEPGDQQAESGGSRINRKAGCPPDAGRRHCGGAASGAGCVPLSRTRRRPRYPDLLGRDYRRRCPQPQVRGRHSPTAWEVPPPICRWLTGATCIWPPSSTATAGAWSAGLCATTCAPASSSTPYRLPRVSAGALKGLSSIPTTAASTRLRRFTRPARTLGLPSRWVRWAPAPTSALAESFNAAFKREVLMDQRAWPDETTCRRQAFRWLTRNKHRPQTLLLPEPAPEHLREPLHTRDASHYAGTRRMNQTLVSTKQGQAPTTRVCAWSILGMGGCWRWWVWARLAAGVALGPRPCAWTASLCLDRVPVLEPSESVFQMVYSQPGGPSAAGRCSRRSGGARVRADTHIP